MFAYLAAWGMGSALKKGSFYSLRGLWACLAAQDIFSIKNPLVMQESWEFDFQYPGERPVDAALAELIEAKAKEIGIYLSYYFRGEGGLVERVGLKEGIDFRDPLAGSLKVSFGLVYFNACLNIHDEAEKDEMLLQFEIDPDRQKVKFTGPYWPQREPDGF